MYIYLFIDISITYENVCVKDYTDSKSVNNTVSIMDVTNRTLGDLSSLY